MEDKNEPNQNKNVYFYGGLNGIFWNLWTLTNCQSSSKTNCRPTAKRQSSQCEKEPKN